VLKRCGAETLRRCNNSRCCDAAALQQLWLLLLFFFFLMILGKFSCTCKKERNKEQEKTRESFETCFGLCLPSSSALI